MLHRVAALVTPPQSTFELRGLAEVFGIDHPGVETRYSFRSCAERPGALAAKAGYRMFVQHGLEILSEADSVFVSGWPDRKAHPSSRLARAVRQAHERGPHRRHVLWRVRTRRYETP
ncbi:type 1 glutamine amidotransferase family protein [Actinomadura physcomitrii]|uniref:hypothetical protein n=1 Tax=Actinomadura physcomitrii TaxID=2650748 RepID=UPI001F210EE3|nr:hypothetical protein [Actinomadura physcomitrii]